MTIPDKEIVKEKSDNEFTWVRPHTRKLKKRHNEEYRFHCEQCGKGNNVNDFRELEKDEIYNVVVSRKEWTDSHGIKGYIDIERKDICWDCLCKFKHREDYFLIPVDEDYDDEDYDDEENFGNYLKVVHDDKVTAEIFDEYTQNLKEHFEEKQNEEILHEERKIRGEKEDKILKKIKYVFFTILSLGSLYLLFAHTLIFFVILAIVVFGWMIHNAF